MYINLMANEVSFDLESSIEVKADSGIIKAKTITFKQPNRKTAPIFQNLVSQFNRGLTSTMLSMKNIVGEEAVEKAQKENEARQESIEDITDTSIAEEVEGMISLMTTFEFDFEKGYKLFDRLIMGDEVRSKICTIDGVGVTEVILDKVSYRDYMKMLVVYVIFFGKPAKSGTKSVSEMQSGSAMQAKEL